MRKLFVVLVLSLLVGCTPSFSLDQCITECNKCGLPCDMICADLQTGIDSEVCHDASQNVWLCALSAGCNFPTSCDVEVAAFLSCEP